MNKNTVWIIIVILLIAVGVYFVAGRETATAPENGSVTNTMPAPGFEGEGVEEMVVAGVKEFTVTGSNFKYDVGEMRVNQGDTVRITFANEMGMHDWVLEGYEGVQTEVIQTGETETIEFVADKTGTFEFYCSVGEHRAMGMVGKLIVE